MSSKMKVLLNFLADWNDENVKNADNPDFIPNKVLVFSQTKKSINVLEKIVQ